MPRKHLIFAVHAARDAPSESSLPNSSIGVVGHTYCGGTRVISVHGSSLVGLSGAVRGLCGRCFASVGEMKTFVKGRRGGKLPSFFMSFLHSLKNHGIIE